MISPFSKVETVANKQLMFVYLYLRNAFIHNKNIFNIAMSEILSPIDNPRYMLIAKTRFNRYIYDLSFASFAYKEYVEMLIKN